MVITENVLLLDHVEPDQFFTEEPPKLAKYATNIQTIGTVEGWNHSESLCQNYIINGFANSLYIIYSMKRTIKELWKSLDRKYKMEDTKAKKKFIVGRFLDYKIVIFQDCD